MLRPPAAPRRSRRAAAAAANARLLRPSLRVANANNKRRRGLPNELLDELAKFAPYNALLGASQANSRLDAFCHPLLRRKHQKLFELYTMDVAPIADWLHAWAARSDSIRTFVRMRARNDGQWCEHASQIKRDLWTLNRARVTTRGLVTDLGSLHTLLHEMGHTLCQTIEYRLLNPPVDWLARFRLRSHSARRFRVMRAHAFDNATRAARVELDEWNTTDLRLSGMLRGLHQLLSDKYGPEVEDALNEFHLCTALAAKCSSFLRISVDWMK